MNYFITGDIHGKLDKLIEFKEKFKNTMDFNNVTVIILGDCAFNFYLNKTDRKRKTEANALGFTILNIKGNHELHADKIDSYKMKQWNGAPVYYEEEFPNLLFAKDGEIYELNDKKVFVMGGAYSVDKYYRILRGWTWFDSEQPDEDTKKFAIENLEKNNWNVDVVLTHTAPLKAEPVHLFLSQIDQSTVDKTTEIFLDDISNKLKFDRWYFGHYHGEWDFDKYHLMFNSWVEL